MTFMPGEKSVAFFGNDQGVPIFWDGPSMWTLQRGSRKQKPRPRDMALDSGRKSFRVDRYTRNQITPLQVHGLEELGNR